MSNRTMLDFLNSTIYKFFTDNEVRRLIFRNIGGFFIPSSEKGTADGVATLASDGKITRSELPVGNSGLGETLVDLDINNKIPVDYLPNSLVEYKGLWNPNTNDPFLVDGTGDPGDTYRVSHDKSNAVTGLTDPSMVDFITGQYILYSGAFWQKSVSTGIPLSYLDTDGTLAANSDSKVATQKATKTYADTKQSALSGTGFVKISGTTISYDNSSYLPLTGGTISGSFNFSGTSVAGLKVKSLTTTQRDALSTSSSNNGELIYNSTTDRFNFVAGGSWKNGWARIEGDTFTGALGVSVNGTTSTSALKLSGNLATTINDKPLLAIETNSSSGTWGADGTVLGVNLANGIGSNTTRLLDLQYNGTSAFYVRRDGVIIGTAAIEAGITGGSSTISSQIRWANRAALRSDTNGEVSVWYNDGNNPGNITLYAAGSGNSAVSNFERFRMFYFSGSGFAFSAVVSGGIIATGSVSSITNSGSGYPISTTITCQVTGNSGTGAIITITTNSNGNVTAAIIVSGGTGYTNGSPTTGFGVNSGFYNLSSTIGGTGTLRNIAVSVGGTVATTFSSSGISVPQGTAAATSINFGTPGTGIYGDASLINFSIGGTVRAGINANGLQTNSVATIAGINNGNISLTTNGITISRSVADANTTLIVNQGNASSTGNLVDFQWNGSSRFNINSGGTTTFNGTVRTGSGVSLFSQGKFGVGGAIPLDAIVSITTTTNASSGTFGTTGWGIRQDACTYTSNAAANTSGAHVAINSFGIPTITSGASQSTATAASTFYIAGAPIASTNMGTVTSLFSIYVNSGNSYFGGKQIFDSITAGSTGDQTINKPSGIVIVAAGASSLVVTNSLVTTSSIVLCTIRTDDATAILKNVVPSSGSFRINLTANATGNTSIGFLVIN